MDTQKLFALYKSLLDTHIATKTSYPLLHSHLEGAYEFAFDCFHTISEKLQDTEKSKPMDDEKAVQLAYKNIEELKSLLESMVKEKQSIGMDNLLRWLCDKAEFICGDLRGFIEQENDEYEEKKAPKKSILGTK